MNTEDNKDKPKTRDEVARARRRQALESNGPLTLPSHLKEKFEKEGLVPRYVKKSSARMERYLRFEDLGYQPVMDDSGLGIGDRNISQGKTIGNQIYKNDLDGEPLVLMAIKKEYYDENQEIKAEANKAIEANIMRNVSKDKHDPRDPIFERTKPTK